MKEAVIAKLEALLQQDDIQAVRAVIGDIKREFGDARRAWRTAQAEAYKAEHENMDDFVMPEDPADEQFKALIQQFKERMDAYKKQKDAEIKAKLEERATIVEELKKLVENVPDNIGQAFDQFKAISEKWKTIGRVPGEKGKTSQSEYNYQADLFHHNISISKDMRDMDLERNLVVKKELIERVQALGSEESIQKMDEEMKKIQQEWKEAGFIPYEIKDEINEQYKAAADVVYEKLRAHFDSLRGEREDNLRLKIALCEQVNAVNAEPCTSFPEWQEKTNQLIKLQNEWKTIGFSDQNEVIWQIFRNACDSFFDAKKAYFNELDKKREANKELKLILIQKAEAAKEDTDWRKTTDFFINLQKDWKQIGEASRKDENNLWNAFRSACDHFFNAKKAFFASREDAEVENLKLKEALIAEIEGFQLSGNIEQDFGSLKEFSNRWREIGYVPIKQKDFIYKKYNIALDVKYDALKISQKERASIKYQNELDGMIKAENSGRAMRNERQQIKDRIEKLKGEVEQYENNLGFFNFTSGKKANPLLQGVQNNIKRLKSEINDLKMRLKMINQAEADRKAAEAKAKEAAEAPEVQAETETDSEMQVES